MIVLLKTDMTKKCVIKMNPNKFEYLQLLLQFVIIPFKLKF